MLTVASDGGPIIDAHFGDDDMDDRNDDEEEDDDEDEDGE